MALWGKYLQKDIYNPSNATSFAGPEKIYAFAKRDGKYKHVNTKLESGYRTKSSIPCKDRSDD